MKGAFDTQNNAFWDPVRKQYWCYIRDFHTGIRDIRVSTSTDFRAWTQPEMVRFVDAPDEPLYTNQVRPYDRAPHLFLGFPTRYIERQWSTAFDVLPDPAHRRARMKFAPRFGAAVTDGQFMTSRDGRTFRRWDETFLRPGPERKDNWLYGDCYQNLGLLETPAEDPTAPPELSLYVTEDNWKRATRLRRYTLRVDGFVALHARRKGGELLTKPLVFHGNSLRLNFATSAAGHLRVEIQEHSGRPLPGFALTDCDEIFGDSLDRAVTWKGIPDVGPLAGKAVRLRVVVNDADLFSLQFADCGLTGPKVSRRAEAMRPVVKIVEGGESRVRPGDCLGTLVGPGINQPDPFPGYGGFLGWVSPILLKNGDWLVGFSAGYWHASAPTPLRFSPRTVAEYLKMGLPSGVVAPTGGRAMIMRSTDEGKTWGKPTTLIDTPDDDRHPAWVELLDGTLVCSLFTYSGVEFADFVKRPEDAHRTVIVRSFDRGRTWDKTLIRPPSPFLADETDGPMTLMKDGSILLTISGMPKEGGPTQAAVFTSQDRGTSWKLLSAIKADHDLDEANATQLPDGRLVLMARPDGDISWSRDQGRTWTAPATFGMRMFAPSLYVLRDGTLVCLHGSYAPGHGGLRLIFSTDGGHEWIAPAKDHGFLVDNCYGYGKAMELPDGTLLVTDQGTGGHSTADAKNMTLRALRVRIRADHSGIDLLPAPNR